MSASAVKSGSASSMKISCPSNVSIASKRSSVVAGLSLRSKSVIGAVDFSLDAFFRCSGKVGCGLIPIVTKSEADTDYLLAEGVHASTRACNARTSATSSAGALPVSTMRAVQVSIQRFIASALKPLVPCASSTNISCPSMNSIALGQCGLAAVGAAAGMSIPSVYGGW